MVSLKPAEKVTAVPKESDPNEQDVAHWFFYTPCAGVTYYAFEARPTRPVRAELQPSVETKVGVA